MGLLFIILIFSPLLLYLLAKGGAHTILSSAFWIGLIVAMLATYIH